MVGLLIACLRESTLNKQVHSLIAKLFPSGITFKNSRPALVLRTFPCLLELQEHVKPNTRIEIS